MNSRKWYALRDTGVIVLLGEFDDFHAAAEFADQQFNTVWIFDHESAEQMKDQLKELT
jgi:hypothetical protein